MDFDNTDCYVFIDDSNLWIEGQKAQGRKLKDTDIDPRYRIDLGKFLKTVLRKNGKERSITNAFLYGSIPPPNDSVWTAAKKKNYKVEVFERSVKGKEKKVDVALATDITKVAMQKQLSEPGSESVFIVVTGDKDLIVPIELALESHISVELWAWEFSMAREFRQKANEENKLTVQKLEDVEMTFSYKEFKSTRVATDIDSTRAIVFRDVPATKKYYNSLANDLCRMLRLFYISCVDTAGGKRDMIVEFPKTKPAVVLRELKRLNIGSNPCSYPEYRSAAQVKCFEIGMSNRYEALSELDESDDALVEAIESSLSIEPEELANDPIDSESEMSDTWIFVARTVAGKKTSLQKRRMTPCVFGIHCSGALECPYFHTEQEMKIFRVQPHIKFKYWKAKLCNKLQEHTVPEQQDSCSFAHTPKDSWCLRCKKFGHLTDDCKAK